MRKLLETRLTSFNLPEDLSWVITSDPEFNQALDYILHTSYDLFINGPAGTGKSVLLKMAYRLLKGTTMVVGSTGIAASHLVDEGVLASTVHCGLKIKPLDIFSEKFDSKDKNDILGRNILTGIDTLLIEEVGMISTCLFDHIGVLVEAAERKRKKPIRVICFGDILQLPPVVKNNQRDISDYYSRRYNGNIFFFNSDFYKRRRFIPVTLDTIYRQSKESFQNILNRLRTDRAEGSDFSIVNSYKEDIDTFKKKHPLSFMLAPTVATVKYLNDKYGVPKNSKVSMTYNAITKGDFNWKEAGLVDPSVTIWEGQQVMCIHNELGSFQNGTLCKVKRLYKDAVIAERADGKELFIKKHKWPQYEYKYDSKSGRVKAIEKGSAVQIGCKPAEASTIHKSQGLTLDSVYLFLEDNWIPPSGIYLGLSRCKTLEGIGLSRNIGPSDIHVMNEPMEFIRSL